MGLVAIAAVVLGIWKRADDLEHRAQVHTDKAQRFADSAWAIIRFPTGDPREREYAGMCGALHTHHKLLSEKYKLAIWRPWILLEDDPELPPDPAHESHP